MENQDVIQRDIEQKMKIFLTPYVKAALNYTSYLQENGGELLDGLKEYNFEKINNFLDGDNAMALTATASVAVLVVATSI